MAFIGGILTVVGGLLGVCIAAFLWRQWRDREW